MALNKTILLRYLKSYDFHKAVVMTSTMVLAGLVLHFLGLTSSIVGVCVGILLVSFCDIQGSYRHRLFAMLLSIVINFCIFVVIHWFYSSTLLLFIVIAILTFSLSFLAVYGNRGSLFAFSGLLGLVLSMIRNYEGVAIYKHALTLAFGGLLFIIASTIYHWLTRKRQTYQQLGELSKQTATFLRLRLNTVQQLQANTPKTEEQLMHLQVEIIERQDKLRELIFADRLKSGLSSSRNRQMLVLIELIDIMELAVANNAIFKRVNEDIVNEKFYLLQPFTFALQNIVERLEYITQVLLDGKSLQENWSIQQQLDIAQYTINDYVALVGLPKARKGALALNNLHDYIEKQAQNINSIERLLSNVTRQRTIKLTKQNQGRFLPKEDYTFETIVDNLSMQSPIFRHSLRLTFAMIAGYWLGILLQVKNPYWILLTVLVIMRPSYGLTKARSAKRVVGTLIGVVLATGLVYLNSNFSFHLIMAILTMILSYSFLNRNYIWATCFITLNIIFAFSLLEPNIWEVIQFRLIDTFIGAGVSLAIGYFIFPFWEHKTIHTTIANAIEKSNHYLQEITTTYLHPKEQNIDYRYSRKNAFIATSQLTASFQRQTQEPKSKQYNLSTYYEIVTILQTMLSTLANLGAYIQNHHFADLTTEFTIITNKITERLTTIEQQIRNKEKVDLKPITVQQDIRLAQEEIEEHWDTLEEYRNKQIKAGQLQIDDNLRLQLQEVRFIQEELNWLLELTENLQEAVHKV